MQRLPMPAKRTSEHAGCTAVGATGLAAGLHAQNKNAVHTQDAGQAPGMRIHSPALLAASIAARVGPCAEIWASQVMAPILQATGWTVGASVQRMLRCYRWLDGRLGCR